MVEHVTQPAHIHSLPALLADIEVLGVVCRVAVDALRFKGVQFFAFHGKVRGAAIDRPGLPPPSSIWSLPCHASAPSPSSPPPPLPFPTLLSPSPTPTDLHITAFATAVYCSF